MNPFSSLPFLGFVLSFPAPTLLQAQSGRLDRLSAAFHPVSSYYYLKPLVGLAQNRPKIVGSDRFIQPASGGLLHPMVGLLLGYHYGRLEVETGFAKGWPFRRWIMRFWLAGQWHSIERGSTDH